MAPTLRQHGKPAFLATQSLMAALFILSLLQIGGASVVPPDNSQLVINVNTTDQQFHPSVQEYMYIYRNNTAFGASAPLLWEIVDLAVNSPEQVLRITNDYQLSFTYRTIEGWWVETHPFPTANEANWVVRIDDFADPSSWQYIVDSRYPTTANTINVRIEGNVPPQQQFQLYLLWGKRPLAMHDLTYTWAARQQFTMSPTLSLLPGMRCFLLPGTPLPNGGYPCSRTDAPSFPLEMLPNKTDFDPPPYNQLYQVFVHRSANNQLSVTSKSGYY
jgi:hypothetical protein